jgi:general secretion pathway protein B
MSIIFEALKKAQAQAEKGQIPTLQTQHGPVSLKEKRSLRTPILAAAFVCAGLGAWWSMRSSDSAAPTTADATSASADTVAATPDAMGTPQQIRVGSGSVVEPGQTRESEHSSETIPNQMGGSNSSNGGPQSFSLPQLDSPMTSVARNEDQKIAPPSDAMQESTPEVMAQFTPDEPVQQIDVSAVPNTSYPQMMTPYTGTASTEPPAPSMPAVAALQKVYELDYQVRHSLPKMSVSMHVYNNNPSRRFVVVNGKRLREGDSVESVQISQIRADGMEVEFQGQRFLYPRM